jgi:hypothetical protein
MMRPQKPHLVRNHDIVLETASLIATPAQAGMWVCLTAKPPLCRSMLSSSLCQYSFFGDVGDKHPLRLVAENIESAA